MVSLSPGFRGPSPDPAEVESGDDADGGTVLVLWPGWHAAAVGDRAMVGVCAEAGRDRDEDGQGHGDQRMWIWVDRGENRWNDKVRFLVFFPGVFSFGGCMNYELGWIKGPRDREG